MVKTTPMMQQYTRIKSENKDSVLFFRLGDFYEMFTDDAKEVSRILNITLTTRHGIPMCGIPYHAADNYIARLLKAGKKIAMCEQVSLPEDGKGIAERKVVEIITPGTVIQEHYLEKEEDNYLAAIGKIKDSISISAIDLSSGDFFCISFSGNNAVDQLKKELYRVRPREIIIQESLLEQENRISRTLSETDGIMINRYPDWSFDLQASYKQLLDQLQVNNLKAFGLDEENHALFTCGVLLEYVSDTSKALLRHVNNIHYYKTDDFVGLDESTQRNLEIVKNQHDGSTRFSLYETLNFTLTSLGMRQLKRWLLQPLKECAGIKIRQNKVEHLYHQQLLLSELREELKKVLDLQRLTSKVAMEKAHGKDLLSIKNSLTSYFIIMELLNEHSLLLPEWSKNSDAINEITVLHTLLGDSIKEDAAVVLHDGGLIKDGYSEELDHLRSLKGNSRAVLEEYISTEKESTGIQNLRIKYNKIIGYFLEVSKGNLSSVPEYFIRRQQLVNGDRFTTERLGELESEINNATEKIVVIEKQLFVEIRKLVQEKISLLQRISQYLSDLDCLQSFAQAATVHGYVKPEINEKGSIIIDKGRHPVVENNIASGSFVPNNTELNSKGKSFALITGPNMAGKSTFLRQTALIVLLAQTGSFIPAEEAKIGLVDQIFCRVGASDNLARGESTFLVEMNETAHILRTGTEKSLVIMDEVGRGTSTNDGLSIAWAVSEELLNKNIKTLFATHYHELTQLSHKRLENLSMDTIEKDSEIIFLKKVVNGSAANSYGIHVARLAGLPEQVVNRARELLKTLVKFEKQIDGSERAEEKQEELFSSSELVVNDVKNCDINNLTPIDAMNLIQRWKNELL